jgi:peptidyl-dipeptidase Dcp
MRRLAILLTIALCACSTTPQVTRQSSIPVTPAATQTAVAARPNPFLTESTLPVHAPPFDQIKDADYQPAIEQGMKEQIAEIDAIANNTAAATFDNTIVPLERSGALLTRVAKVFFNLTGSNTNDVMQKIEKEEAPKLAAHQDTIYLNSKLFARVKAIYDNRASLGFDAETKQLV